MVTVELLVSVTTGQSDNVTSISVSVRTRSAWKCWLDCPNGHLRRRVSGGETFEILSLGAQKIPLRHATEWVSNAVIVNALPPSSHKKEAVPQETRS